MSETLHPRGPGKWFSQAWGLMIRDFWFYVAATIVSGLVSIVPFLYPAMHAGLVFVAMERTASPPRGGIDDLWRGFSKWWPFFVFNAILFLVVGMPFLIGFTAFLVPVILAEAHNTEPDPWFMFPGLGLYLVGFMLSWLFSFVAGILFAYAPPLMADAGMGPLDAMRASYRKVTREFRDYGANALLVTVILSACLVFSSNCYCCLPLLVVVPFTTLAIVAAYRDGFSNVGSA